MLLPSILEYDKINLNRKLEYLSQNYDSVDFKAMVRTESSSKNFELKVLNGANIHLDFVMPQFAKDRGGILTSEWLDEVFIRISSNFKTEIKLNLSVHLMGTLEDLHRAWLFFETFEKPKNWAVTILIDPNQYLAWKRRFKNYTFGIWLDLSQWLDADVSNIKAKLRGVGTILLMTVVAGKSGQKLTPEVKIMLNKFIQTGFSTKKIILDGGWDQLQAKEFLLNSKIKNIDFVSYSGFWGKLEV